MPPTVRRACLVALGSAFLAGAALFACTDDGIVNPAPVDDSDASAVAVPDAQRDAMEEDSAMGPLPVGDSGKLPADASVDAQVEAATVYGLIESAAPGMVAAVGRSRRGIDACTYLPAAHTADAFQRWGAGTWFNDLYFGLHGAFYIGGARQHLVVTNELRKIAPFVVASPAQAVVPYTVSFDGLTAQYNTYPGMDMDRAAMFVLMLARTYAMTGDTQLVSDLYPKALVVVDFLKARDLDGDLVPEGRTEDFTPGTGVGAGSSISYIGDSVANTWKDFGAALFLYDALQHLASLEDVLGKSVEASGHRADASALRTAVTSIYWNPATSGFLGWIEQDGTRHADWITGNNLHAIACGLTTTAQANAILARLEANRADVEDIVPCRSRIGVFDAGLCSNGPDYYWNGGAWTLIAAPDMLARAQSGDLSGALRVANRLANLTPVTNVGFFEAYDGVTGATNGVEGQLMDNGGFLWGLFAGVYGLDVDGDALVVRATVPANVIPAKATFYYRGSDVHISWIAAATSSVTLNGQPVTVSADGITYRMVNALPKLPAGMAHELVISVGP